MPISTVMASASSGDVRDITRDGSGRASSLSMLALLTSGAGTRRRLVGGVRCTPEAAHPGADHLDGRLGGRHARRDLALRDDDEPVADLEQLVELLADDEHRAAAVAQREKLAP